MAGLHLVVTQLYLLVISLSISYANATTSLPAPIVALPSQQWGGNDGPWSTFTISVGTPAQKLSVLISTGSQETWVVVPEGCTASDPSNCGQLRGGEFIINSSSTWESTASIYNNTGLFELDNQVSSRLDLEGNGKYGFDTVAFDWQNGDGPALNHTIVAGIATKDYYLGQFGVSPRSTNFTTTNDNSSAMNAPQTSYLSLLKENNYIPSLSYSYTAGSYSLYRSASNTFPFGSLVFGGFDASRFTSNNVSFQFAADDGRELVVAIQSITHAETNGAYNLLPQAVYAALDTSQANIWLPLSACQQFESKFGLVWNETAEMYLINDTQHAFLLAANPSLTFRLGESVSGGATVDITLPYGAFDLTASHPLVSNSTRYFPLKRAANETQYVLGRTFFQEAYLTADYARRNFSLSQTLWNATAVPRIVSILPSGNSTNTSNSPSASSGLSTGAIAGVAVGAVAAVAAMLAAAVLVFRRQRRHRDSISKAGGVGEKDGVQRPGTDEKGAYAEIGGVGQARVEVEGVENMRNELDGGAEVRPELPSPPLEVGKTGVTEGVYELPVEDRRYELWSGR